LNAPCRIFCRRCRVSCCPLLAWLVMSRVPVALHLNKEQLAAIGYFAAHWNYFETEMDFTITAMTFAVHRHQKMPFPFDDRIKEWKKLLPRVVADRRALGRYQKLIKNAETAHDTRSKFLHSKVLGDPKRRTRTLCFENNRHRHGDWRVRPIVVSARKICAIARAIGELTAELIQLNQRFLEKTSPKSLPCTFPAPPRDGPSLVHRGRNQSSARKIRRRSSLA
jgi:hypothetical protein